MHPLARAAIRRGIVGLTLCLPIVAGGCAPRARTNFLPPSRPAQFSFAGIPWGIAADSVTALVEPRGYNFNSADGDGDLVYDGMLMRTPTRVFAFLTPEKKLVKFRVLMMTPDANAVTTYDAVRARLIEQYGTPRETIEEYEKPYRKGDKKQLEAIRSGKATLVTHWLVGDGARQSHVSVQVVERLVVAVDYEGPQWDRESVRRRRVE